MFQLDLFTPYEVSTFKTKKRKKSIGITKKELIERYVDLEKRIEILELKCISCP